jgi:hypothetical protein
MAVDHQHPDAQGLQPHASPDRRSAVLGSVFAAVCTAALLIGSGRRFGYDSAVTVHRFVDGDAPLLPLVEQHVYNNHPLFSVLESLVAALTGSTGEVVMRVLPAAFLGAAAGLLVWRLGRRFGLLPGLAGGLVLVTSPLLLEVSREVRGYSLAVLAVVVMGIAVLEPGPRRPTLFGLALAVGVATHLYVVMPAVLAGYVLIREGRLTAPWRRWFLVGALIAVLTAWPMLGQPSRGRTFHPSWPLDGAWELAGATALSAISLGVIIGVALWRRWIPRLAVEVSVIACGLMAIVWLVAPRDLYTRFLYWAVPPLALLVGYLAGRRWILVLSLVASFASLGAQVDTWGDAELDTGEVARTLEGVEVCGGNDAVEAIQVYAPQITRTEGCDVVVYLVLGAAEVDQDLDQWPARCPDPGPELVVRARRPGLCPS